jgi:branched-subunit amino acid aminotransferase/4-amino-4-deoxychorismate lyase
MPKEDVRIELNDLGFERGFAVFDYCRVRGGKITFLSDHLDRLMHSQSVLNLKVPVEMDVVKNILTELQSQNNSGDAYFKIIISARMENEQIIPVLTVYEDVFVPYPQKMFDHGIALILHEFAKPYPEYKTTFYLSALREYYRMKENNAEDVLFYFEDVVRECARCNIFIVKGNAIYTPDKNMLKGVTRKHVIICASENFFVIENDITVSDLFSADEVFITSTTKNIMPVTRIEDRLIGNGQAGILTKELMQLFSNYCEHYVAD